nr:MAG TPA: hypothetical protein [Caudoviricetes sp.]
MFSQYTFHVLKRSMRRREQSTCILESTVRQGLRDILLKILTSILTL